MSEKKAHVQKLAISKKSTFSYPILMKLRENDYLLRWLFIPSFMKIQQKMFFFTNGQFLNVGPFFDSGFMLANLVTVIEIHSKAGEIW